MSATASIAGFMKRHVAGPSLIRRNPFFYDAARRTLDDVERMDIAGRRAWSDAQVKRTLQCARRAAYGRRVNGGDTAVEFIAGDQEQAGRGDRHRVG